MAKKKLNEKKSPQSIGKEIEVVENRLRNLGDEVNSLLSYLRFLKERKLQFDGEEERSTSSVRQSATQVSNVSSRRLAENDPQTEKQYKVTLLFMILLFATMALFWIAGGVEGAKTAWLLLGPMLSVMIYTLFKSR